MTRFEAKSGPRISILAIGSILIIPLLKNVHLDLEMNVDFVQETADLSIGCATIEVGNEGLLVTCLRIFFVTALFLLAAKQPSQALSSIILLLFLTNGSLLSFFCERLLPVRRIICG